MGYDMQIVVLKRKTLEKARELNRGGSFSCLYNDFLFTRLCPDDYEFPKEEEGRVICSESRDVFKGYFENRPGNGEAVLIEEEEYKKMFEWLKHKLETITLLDLARSEKDAAEVSPLIQVYRDMCDNSIDFETEFVVFEHDW